MAPKRPRVGDVVQIALPNGRYAYGRVLRDASIAIYRQTTTSPAQPPLGSREYQFVVGVYEDVLQSGSCPVVGHDPSRDGDDEWPPASFIRDPISGDVSLYHKGIITPAAEDEVSGLERASVWDLNHIVDRITGEFDWSELEPPHSP
jgi:hypothetical protein